MAEERLLVVEHRKRGRPPAKKKVNGIKKINWEEMKYEEMMGLFDKLVGKKPKVPEDIVAPMWSEQALRVLKERYFLKDEEGKAIESVEEMCWRVAWEMARAEVKFGLKREKVEALAREFYRILLNRWYLPNSPTLMNAGKSNGMQYNGCYVIPIDDNLESIFDGVKWQGLIHQSGGGTGFAFSRLRPKGSRVRTTTGVASGPVSFMRIYNEATQQIKQGGTRRGANMGVLRVDHPDIMEFIHCKEDGGITNFNISVTITDEFMKALLSNQDYELVDPHTNQVAGRLSAAKVWDEIAAGAWKTGDPGLIFIDRINKSAANPIRLAGWEIETTNPCGEQPLYPFDACNLGSIFLGYMVKDTGKGKKEIDWEKLKEVTHLAVRFMDNVIEMNPVPLPQIAQIVKKIRRLGLGVGGWADALVELGIPYDSEEALELGEKVMKFINTEGHRESERLARERGAFPLWKDSMYADGKQIRNSTITTIAPTGSIGILADSSGGIEPLFAIAYQHVVKTENRTLTFVNSRFEQVARERGFYSEELMKLVAQRGTVREIKEVPEDVRQVFGTAHEIAPEWHIKMQAMFQKNTDNAVSKTINFRHDVTVDEVKKAYMLAWETGCRGITVFRDGCKGEQVLNLGVQNKSQIPPLRSQAEPGATEGQAVKPRPVRVEGATYRIETPLGSAFITVNHDDDGNPFEVFVIIGKAGSEVAAMAEALGRLISTTLRFGNHLPAKERAKEIMEQLAGIGGSRSVGFGHQKVRSLPDAVAKAIGMHFGLIGYKQDQGEQVKPVVQGDLLSGGDGHTQIPLFQKRADLCPKCGEAALVFEEGCKKCYGCGYSEC
jgi:ribonucleoside-diphosphate reductase alpha chain